MDFIVEKVLENEVSVVLAVLGFLFAGFALRLIVERASATIERRAAPRSGRV